MSTLNIDTVVVGTLEENCYILWADGEKTAVLIDPGDEGEKIRRILDEKGLSAGAVLLTHGHFDHTGAVNDFPECPLYIHEDDACMLQDPYLSAGKTFGDICPRRKADVLVHDGDSFQICGLSVRVMHTPGHTPGSVCYLINEDTLLTGDTLFHRSYGSTAFPGGDQAKIFASLRMLLHLPDYPVYPGHGEKTTIQRERSGL